jgi:hypothetical protein
VTFSKSTLLRLLIESSTNREMAAWLRGFFLHIKKVRTSCTYTHISLAGSAAAAVLELSYFNLLLLVFVGGARATGGAHLSRFIVQFRTA